MNGKEIVTRSGKLKFGVRVCLIATVGMLAVTLFLDYITSARLGGSYAEAIYTIYDLKIRIFPLFFASFYSIFILAAATLAIAAVSIFFSHKIAGPIYRIEKNLERVASGDLTVETRFRGKDELTAVADEINAMVRGIGSSIRSMKGGFEELKREADGLEALLKEESPPYGEVRASIERIRGMVQALKGEVSAFKVSP